MSSVVVSGDSDNGVLSEGKEGNPIELDDTSTNTNNSDEESQNPLGPNILKEESNLSDHSSDNSGHESGDESGDESQEINSESHSDNDDSDSDSDSESESESDDDCGGDSDDDFGEDGGEENSEGDDDDDMNIDAVENIVDKGKLKITIENDEEKSGSDSSSKVPQRFNRTKHLYGNIESMAEIIKSPYEGNECAEVGEECFEELRELMDGPTNDGAINPRMVALVGDKLAGDLSNAHREIGKSGMLYSANWKEGKIRESDFGWIPKRQLLLCLHEHRFAKGDVNVLKLVSKSLDCTKLVLEAMKLWDLMEAYPNLASNKSEETFSFGPQKVICYKCQIFIARAFATLQTLNKTEEIQQSLMRKIKACLAIMNKHVRTNQIELARIRKKDSKRSALLSTYPDKPDAVSSMDRESPLKRTSPYSRKRKKPASVRSPKTKEFKIRKSRGPRKSREPKSGETTTTTEPNKRTYKRRRKLAESEDREESIFMLFDTMQMQLQRLNQMMSFFQSQLQDHRYSLREEIRENIEKENQQKDGEVEL